MPSRRQTPNAGVLDPDRPMTGIEKFVAEVTTTHKPAHNFEKHHTVYKHRVMYLFFNVTRAIVLYPVSSLFSASARVGMVAKNMVNF